MPKPKILIVDDEVFFRRLFTEILSEGDLYSIESVGSGKEALDYLSRTKVDIILTDMVMPDGMTGRELAEIVQFDNPEIKIIFTSGYNVEIVGKDFSLHEGINFVQKPYHPKKLAKAVRDCLDNLRVEA